MLTKRKEYRLPEDVIAIIDQVKNDGKFSSETETLINIVRSYSTEKSILSEIEKQEIAELVVNKYHEKYKKTFDRIRLASSASERYAYVILNAVNTVLFQINADFLMPANGETKHAAVQEAEDLFKGMLEHNKQIKDDNRVKKG